jgi:hypothetical protein
MLAEQRKNFEGGNSRGYKDKQYRFPIGHSSNASVEIPIMFQNLNSTSDKFKKGNQLHTFISNQLKLI